MLKLYEHDYSAKREIKFEEFQDCWWNYSGSDDYVKYYLTPFAIWSRYINQLGLEFFYFDPYMKYLENLAKDYKDQNWVIEEYTKFIRYGLNHNENYSHFYLCEEPHTFTLKSDLRQNLNNKEPPQEPQKIGQFFR